MMPSRIVIGYDEPLTGFFNATTFRPPNGPDAFKPSAFSYEGTGWEIFFNVGQKSV